MSQQNNHYVPQFLLKRFGEKINVYDVKSAVLTMRKRPDKVFCSNGLYEDELEHLFNVNAESKVANLLFNKILTEEAEVSLDREELLLLKKFFAIEQLRTPDSKLYIRHEREDFEKTSPKDLEKLGYFDNPTSKLNDEEYLKQTLKNILEYNGYSEKDFLDWLKDPNVTYSAQKWMKIYMQCYLSFWDSKKSGEDFLISDIGMTCEHDPSKFLHDNSTQMELLKPGFYISLLENPNYSEMQKRFIIENMVNGSEVRANFYFFSLTATRTIVLIDPFFRIFDKDEPWTSLFHLPLPDIWPSGFIDRSLIEKNKALYENIEKAQQRIFSPNDKYIYKIHDMELEDVLYYNSLLLDRIDSVIGFGESKRIIRSLASYLQVSAPRNDYRKLKTKLENIGYSIPSSEKYRKIAHDFVDRPKQAITKGSKYIQYAIYAMNLGKTR